MHIHTHTQSQRNFFWTANEEIKTEEKKETKTKKKTEVKWAEMNENGNIKQKKKQSTRNQQLQK